eukprot:CAMPEP_0118662132 /NCGR_PEP_ID=MMETSP0785-20121206/16656_1 /TAXON_ID=91992 /ORGANISM="Bolidomonas pacifica, Strain CCMP 1866" /LENGTH=95 /DNA_ID=CAMNT_0006555631 /DNA_START=307 /DNA_END=591 /DNA_ORIENTATION=+
MKYNHMLQEHKDIAEGGEQAGEEDGEDEGEGVDGNLRTNEINDELGSYLSNRTVVIKRAMKSDGTLVKKDSVNRDVVKEKLLKQHKVLLEEEEGE